MPSKVFILCEVEDDYLEIADIWRVFGVFTTRKAAREEAKRLKLREFRILPRVVQN